MVLTLSAVADRKKILLEKLNIDIQYHIRTEIPWQTSLNITIDVGKGLSQRERTILYNSARLCEVSRLLTGEFSFDYTLAPETAD